VIVALAIVLALGAATSDGDDRFAQATALMADDRAAEAAEALEALARELPGAARAPDALFTAATLYEERLDQPSRALALYGQLVARYPRARAARAAATRAKDLRALLGPDASGAAPAAAFSEVKRVYDEIGDAAATARVEALLTQYPSWTGRDQAVLWLAQVHARQGRYAAAERRFTELAETWPEQHGFTGLRGAGDMALARGDHDLAERYYRRMRIDGDPGWARAHGEALAKLARERRRRVMYIASCASLVLALGALIASLWLAARSSAAGLRALARPPTEAIYFVPVAGVMLAAALTGHRLIAPATAIVLATGLGATWLSGAGLRLAATRWRVAFHAAASALAVVAATYIALHRTRLFDFVVETLRHGPER
jgi:tetratricopeptide (TPR) repeat protein